MLSIRLQAQQFEMATLPCDRPPVGRIHATHWHCATCTYLSVSIHRQCAKSKTWYMQAKYATWAIMMKLRRKNPPRYVYLFQPPRNVIITMGCLKNDWTRSRTIEHSDTLLSYCCAYLSTFATSALNFNAINITRRCHYFII